MRHGATGAMDWRCWGVGWGGGVSSKQGTTNSKTRKERRMGEKEGR